jgi:hypothetical protein
MRVTIGVTGGVTGGCKVVVRDDGPEYGTQSLTSARSQSGKVKAF